MHASDICSDWLTNTLHSAGVLPSAVAVTDIETRPIGTGQVADSFQIHADYSDVTTCPASFVAKISSDAELSRAAGRTELNYLREVRFYQEIAEQLPVRVPLCYHGEIDSNNTEFVLLLEDLSPARQGDQLKDSSLDEVELAVREAARIHAPFWGSEELVGNPWLDISASYWARFTEMIPQWWAGFIERYRDRLGPDDIALGTLFSDNIEGYYRALRTIPFTVQHGDFRPDNVLFEAGGGSVEIAVLDWQTVLFAPGPVDVAYFIGGALDPDSRRVHEPELLARYHRELVANGVSGYSLADLERDYPIGTFQNFVIGVAAAMLVARSDRGDNLFLSMVTRSLDHARAHDAMNRIVSVGGEVEYV